MPRTGLRFLHKPWGGICVWMRPIVTLSANDSARQFDCDKGSILHCSQQPSLYRLLGGHADTSGHVGIIDEMTTCPFVMSQEKVVQLSTLCHVAPISYNLLSTTHFVLRHSPQHLLGIDWSSWPCFRKQWALMRFSFYTIEREVTYRLTDNVTHFTLCFNYRIAICVKGTDSFHANILCRPHFIDLFQYLLSGYRRNALVWWWTFLVWKRRKKI
jgi:hypothetical protein